MGTRPGQQITLRRTELERFEEKYVVIPDACWIWTGYATDGYGQFSFSRQSGKHVGAHIWSYLHFVGPIPDGFHVDHLCERKLCVNWRHLEAVTAQVNTLRYHSNHKTPRKTHCKRGHHFDTVGWYEYHRGSRIVRVCRQCVFDRNHGRL